MKLLVSLMLLLTFLAQETGSVDSKTIAILKAVVAQGNQNVPIRLTPTLTMERYSTNNGQLTYHYRSTFSDATTFDLSRFVKDKTKELTKLICTEGSQQIFRNLKVVLNYEYSDKNDKLLTVISIDAGQC